MRSVVKPSRFTALVVPVCALVALSLSGCGGSDNPGFSSNRTVIGRAQTVSGSTVKTWANLDSSDKVTQVGVTVPSP